MMDVRSAIDEMLWTSRNAELLKQEAGIRAGGRETENAVKHLSLNWSPNEAPTREHMIAATEDFLRQMKWDEHQALLVSHQDKSHPHVHVMLNAVNPENGLKLDEGFEYRRAQKWALEYEREYGIVCENRLENVEDREASPTRPMWQAFQKSEKEFERDEKSRQEFRINSDESPENPKNAKSLEWQALKELQRNERTEFFADGKAQFSELRRSVYLDVREEFRPRWADYFEAVKSGGNSDELDRYKADLVAEQKTVLDTRRDAACTDLRESRDSTYRQLLGDQQELRTGMLWRQEAGLDCSQFLKLVEDGGLKKSGDLSAAFRESAFEVTVPVSARELPQAAHEAPIGRAAPENSGMRSGTDIGVSLTFGAALGIASLADSLADGFVSGRRAPRARTPEPERAGPNPFQVAADESAKQSVHKRELEDADWRKRQQERYWE